MAEATYPSFPGLPLKRSDEELIALVDLCAMPSKLGLGNIPLLLVL
jgi:hypothetical protein